MQALKINASGEFEESLRVVVKCIYNPSKYYSKVIKTQNPLAQYQKADLIHSWVLGYVQLLQRSMQSAATDKRLVTRAILGSDDVGIDNIRSAFKSTYGRNLADCIHENLAESDYHNFLVAVARGPVAP